MDPSSLCRSCMKELGVNERDMFDKRAVYMFSMCTNIKISEDDRLPKQFCQDCIAKIESSYTYIQQAQKVDISLRSLIQTQHSVIVEPPQHKNTECTIPLDYDSYEIDNETAIKTDDTNVNENRNNVKDADGKIPNIVVEKFECRVCKKNFLSKVWYDKHMTKAHSGKKHICMRCDKSFVKPWQLTVHSITHSEERRHACGVCGKRYKRRKELTIHARTHADARPYQCDHCHMSFKLKNVLRSHMVQHEAVKPFLCPICGWSFFQAGNLDVHMRTHTGEKPFACQHCSFRAAAASNMRRHERRHRGLGTHSCAQCGKTFYDASGLTRHIRTHTGARPYKCPVCERSFTDSWKRKTHLTRAHGVPLANIPRMPLDTSQCVVPL